MARVFPKDALISSPSAAATSPCYVSSDTEVFTIWMKSIVLNGNGCTVFDAKGDIVYRIDNYNSRCRTKVHLMDLRGSVLFSILKKKFRLFGRWEGYRQSISRPWFQVRKICAISKRKSPCEVTVKLGEHQSVCYKVENLGSKLGCKIVEKGGGTVAEVKKKQTSSGVVLGDDVFTLVVQPCVDHSLIMGIVAVYGLINRKM